MDLDAEILEHYLLRKGILDHHEDWRVDGTTLSGHNIDIKFIRKYWNVSREKTLNIIKQWNILDRYEFYEWTFRPRRPLELNDEVQVTRLGSLSYDVVANNLRKSYKEPDGFYIDVRALLYQTDDRRRTITI